MEPILPVLDNKDTIFHYTKMGVAVEHILYENRFIFSKGRNTNDPREYSDIDLEPYSEGEYTPEDFFKDWREAEEEFKGVTSSYRFACFCSNKFPEQGGGDDILEDQYKSFGYDRLRMWAQYGESFYGVCIGFSVERLLKRLRETLSERAVIRAQRVNYEKNLEINHSSLSNAYANEYKNRDKGQWAEKHVQERLKQLFFVKHVDYRDENEYRIVVHDPTDALDEGLDIIGCIKAVILGDRAKLVYHQIVQNLCTQMGIECKSLVWRRGRLQLEDVEV
jgi:hypothetical protein